MRRIIVVCMACLLFVFGAMHVETQGCMLYLPIVFKNIIPYQGAGATYADCARIAATELTWYYDWSPYPPGCPSTKHRVAMIWGKAQVGVLIEPGIDWVMGFNEPELSTQANITPTLGG